MCLILCTPLIFETYLISSEKFIDLLSFSLIPLYAFTFCPSNIISLTPFLTRQDISKIISSNVLLTSSPRVYGTTQKVQYLLHPSIIDTYAHTLDELDCGK